MGLGPSYLSWSHLNSHLCFFYIRAFDIARSNVMAAFDSGFPQALQALHDSKTAAPQQGSVGQPGNSQSSPSGLQQPASLHAATSLPVPAASSPSGPSSLSASSAPHHLVRASTAPAGPHDKHAASPTNANFVQIGSGLLAIMFCL